MTVAHDTAAELVYRIFDLQRTIRCTAAAAVRHSDLGIAQEGVLRFISEGVQSRASDIAARLGIGASALSRQVADLEEHGLIVRRPDPADGRAHLLSLSAKGEEYLAEVERTRIATVQAMLSGWSEDEACATAQTVQNLNAALRAGLKTDLSRATAAGFTGDHGSETLKGVN